MEKPVLTELPTISDRMTFIYLEHCRISRELFPAYAGVILVKYFPKLKQKTFPRVCGGDPKDGPICCEGYTFSPRMRG